MVVLESFFDESERLMNCEVLEATFHPNPVKGMTVMGYAAKEKFLETARMLY